MTAVTLTAGTYNAGAGQDYYGYWPALGFGSISGELSPSGVTSYWMMSTGFGGNGRLLWQINGDATAFLTGLTHVKLNGVNYPVSSAAAFNGTTTDVTFGTGEIPTLVNGSSNSLDLVGVTAYAGPTYVGKTPFVSAAGGSVNVDYSTTGRQAGDLLVHIQTTTNRPFTTDPTGFTQDANSPQSSGTAGAAGGVRLGVWRKISDGTETTVTGAAFTAGDTGQGIGIVLRGVDPTTPIHVSIGSVAGTASASISFPGVTTTEPNCLIINILNNDRDINSTANLTAVANSALANLTLRHDQTVSTAAGGGIAVITGEKTTAGATGSTTATNAASNTYAMITLAVRAPASGGTPSVTAANATHGHTATQPSLAAKSTIAPANATHGHTASQPSLAAKSTVAPANTTHSHTATSPTVSTATTVTPANATHGHTATQPSLAAKSTVAPANTTHGHTATQPSLAAKSTVAPANATHGHTATQPSLAASGAVTVASTTHGHTADSPSISTNNSVAPTNATHGHTASSPTLASVTSIAPNNAAHGHTATQPSLVIRYTLTVNSSAHGHTAGQPTLGFAATITLRAVVSVSIRDMRPVGVPGRQFVTPVAVRNNYER